MQQPKYCFTENIYYNQDGSISKTKTALVTSAINVVNQAVEVWKPYLENVPKIILSELEHYSSIKHNELTHNEKFHIQDAILQQIEDKEAPQQIFCQISDNYQIKFGICHGSRHEIASDHASQRLYKMSEQEKLDYIASIGQNEVVHGAIDEAIWDDLYNSYFSHYRLCSKPDIA